ncbi:MAG: hypothetical protein QOF84_2287 [Streptomyces sp.]|jgi:DNA-binding CsgD family transcriptional regulator|nr:hypothetical protein [Streptomyces sp.]
MDNKGVFDEPAPDWRLSPTQMRVYKWAVARGFVSADETADVLGLSYGEAREAMEALVGVHLMESRDGGGDDSEDGGMRWCVLNPQIAAARLAATESRLRQLIVDLNTSRQAFGELADLYSALDDARTVQHPVEVVGSLSDVLSLVDEASARCKVEMITCQPGGGRPPEQLEQAAARDIELLCRGVRMRTLYQHSARHHVATSEYVDRVTGSGAEVRTSPELFGRMLGFDRSLVFIPHHSIPGGAAVIRDPSTISFLYGAFNRAWDLALPFSDSRLSTAGLTDVQRNILRLLSEGVRDETMARRLGVSLRTCRKYVAEIFDELGAQSRFQAGYLTGDRALLK